MNLKVYWSEAKKYSDNNFGGLDYDGVYIIGYRNTTTNKRYVVYVGQGNIGNRLSDHYYNNQKISDKIKSGGIGYYRFFKCMDENDRLDIELGLYNKYGGKNNLCNDVDPPGSGSYSSIEVDEAFK